MADGTQTSLLPQSAPSYTVPSATNSSTGSEAYAAAVSANSNLLGSWRDNPNYKLTLTDITTGTTVTCYIPEQTSLRLQNQWETILSVLGGGYSRFDRVKDIAQVTTGMSLNYKALTTKVWRNSEPLTFDFKLEFDAKEDVNKDVVQPVMNLIQMTSPSRSSGALGAFLLEAPGPTLTNPNRRISLRLGKFLYVDSVVVNSLDIGIPTAFDEYGRPIAVDCEISLETWYTPDKSDIQAYFNLAQNSLVSEANPLVYNAQDLGGGGSVTATLTSLLDKVGL